MLLDNHGRTINYLRLAVTDRCNLRCFYCMPEQGLDWLSRTDLMTYEELLRLSTILVNHGIDKIRITGGEPFVRKDIMTLMRGLAALPGLRQLLLTTNGVLTEPYVPELKRLGVKAVNLSLDTLDRERFLSITRRDELPAVLRTLEALLRHGIEVKINAVVMEGRNTADLLPLADLARNAPVSVRFIEEMPFNGTGHAYSGIKWNYRKILEVIQQRYPDLQKLPDPPFSTSSNYRVPGHQGTIGVIAAYSRTFCGTCNRLRLTPEGVLKTCLYDNGVMNVRELLRSGHTDGQLMAAFNQAIASRAADGWQAAQQQETHTSMAAIGG